MKSFFRFKGKYRTDLTQEEVSARIEQLIQHKSKFLFFTFNQCFGNVYGSEFTLSRQRFDFGGMMSSRLKGSITYDSGTVVRTHITIPWVILAFFSFYILTALSILLKADEITVNGIVRPAGLLDKFIMVLAVLVFPACLIYFTTIMPAKRIQRKLIGTLHLKEYRDGQKQRS